MANASLTKEQALANIEELKAYVASLGQRREPALRPSLTVSSDQVASRFALESGVTGVIVRWPESYGLSREKLRMPVTEYLLREFARRGGKTWDLEDCVERWSSLRWPRGANQLWEYAARVDRALYDALPEQPTLGNVAGTTEVFFLDTAQDVETHKGQSFNELLAAKVNLPSPIAWLALALTAPDLANVQTYPTWKYWEWVGAIGVDEDDDELFAACGVSYSGGLGAGWDGPEDSNSYGRARPVVR